MHSLESLRVFILQPVCFLHNIRTRALPRHNKATAQPIRHKLFELALILPCDANAQKETVCLRWDAAV